MTAKIAAAVLIAVSAAATPPPTILRERVSPVCTTLHQLVLPLARMEIQNRQIMLQMAIDQMRLAKYSNTKLQDGRMMYVSKLDMEAGNLITHIHEVEMQLRQSYAAYPQGRNPKVDAMRQHVQNIVDIDRVAANNYSAYYGSILDNDEINAIANSVNSRTMVGDPNLADTPPPVRPDPLDAFPTPMPPGPIEALIKPMSADADPAISSTPGPQMRLHSLKYDRPGELRTLLYTEGHELTQQALVAARDCDGA